MTCVSGRPPRVPSARSPQIEATYRSPQIEATSATRLSRRSLEGAEGHYGSPGLSAAPGPQEFSRSLCRSVAGWLHRSLSRARARCVYTHFGSPGLVRVCVYILMCVCVCVCLRIYIHTYIYNVCVCVKIIYTHAQATRVFTLAAGTARARAALFVNATRTSSTRHEPGG